MVINALQHIHPCVFAQKLRNLFPPGIVLIPKNIGLCPDAAVGTSAIKRLRNTGTNIMPSLLIALWFCPTFCFVGKVGFLNV
jgi:hypothetical protein